MSENEIIMTELRGVQNELKEAKSMLRILVDSQLRSKQWLTPEEAGKMINRSPAYLIKNKDTLGIVYSQPVKYGKVLFEYDSVLQWIEKKNNRKYLKH